MEYRLLSNNNNNNNNNNNSYSMHQREYLEIITSLCNM